MAGPTRVGQDLPVRRLLQRPGSSCCHCHVCWDTLVVSHAAGRELAQLSANETLAFPANEKISGVTFRDEEERGVEGGLDRSAAVDHPRLVDPLEGALLRVPLHGVEGVVVG